jgi:GNAT superfamily N-acetyltransferase
MDKEVKRFGKSLVGDFYRIHNEKNSAGWCFCAAWWVENWDGWSDRNADENRLVRNELLARGEYDGYLLYQNHEPVGWCQVGPRDRLEKLTRQFNLNPAPDTWAITCFLITPGNRRTGLAIYLLQQILADLQSRGVGWVEVFPKRGSELDATDMWNGPESMYLRAGFKVIVDRPERPVLAINLTALAS